MTKRNSSLIKSLSIALLGCMLVSSSLYGQSESALKKFFEGKTVVVRIDMPGNQKGVDVYPERADSIDWEEYRRELKKYGTALSKGQEETITKIATKSKHIEFQLDGGGWGTWTDSGAFPTVSKSSREKELDRLSYPGIFEKRELADLQQERSRRNEKIKIARNRARSEGGSRFNILYEYKLTVFYKTPKSVMAALSEYLDFPFTEEDRPATSDDADARR